jgi:hypothetical protein
MDQTEKKKKARCEMKLLLQRRRKTVDGIFGTLTAGGLICASCENLQKAIPAGTYKIVFDYSPRFQRELPHILVPSRDAAAGGDAGIRIHPANYPRQLDGCIAPGDREDENAVWDSRDTMVKLLKIISGRTDLEIEIIDIPNRTDLEIEIIDIPKAA